MSLPEKQFAQHHLSDLNPEQLRAVRHGSGPLLIFAGAGSGKTRVLTRRIANLVLEYEVHPERIFAVTFTNKAAQEMKHRVSGLFQHRLPPAFVSTFHSSCARLLRIHAEKLDYTQDFAIYDSDDSLSTLKRVYKQLGVDPQIIDPRFVRSTIDRSKNNYLFSDSIRSDRSLPESLAQLTADIYLRYQEELRKSNAMDFGDLLCNMVTLLKLEPAILEHYQDQFQYFLVDEYQDTNRVQYLLIQMLSAKTRNLCVVGDDDQSIYAFRGATIENILSFQKDFPDAAVIKLEQNYRSTKNILDCANAVIALNRRRQPKTMRTENGVGEPVVCFRAYDEREEADFVAREIITLKRNNVPLSNIAIFYRTNAQSRALEEALCENAIPYEIFGGHRFYDRKEIKDILAYFRLVLNEDDNEAFLRIINTPTRGLGATSIGALVAHCQKHRVSFFRGLKEALQMKPAPTFLSSANIKKFSGFIQIISALKEELQSCSLVLASNSGDVTYSTQVNALAQFLESIAKKSRYLEKLKAEDTPEAQSRIENIYELMAVAADFVARCLEEQRTPMVRDFLDRTSLASDLDKENTSQGGLNNQQAEPSTGSISLMTLHLAKGLEFDVVFLVGLEEGLLPHVRSIDSETELEEERRLFYVGMTRGKRRLFLCRASTRQSYGRGNWNSGVASRFLKDIPPKFLEFRNSELLQANS